MESRLVINFLFLIIFSFKCLAESSSNVTNMFVTSLYAFGDSTLDPGNNNHLNSFYRVDHPPYGRDFPTGVATGRFSNGLLVTDYIASFLGLKNLLPAYFDPKLTDEDLLSGVSFASGGSGLRNDASDHESEFSKSYLDMSDQLDYFDEAVKRMEGVVGLETTKFIIEHALFFISDGGNDMMRDFSHWLDLSNDNAVSAYHETMIRGLESSIKRLVSAGGRKFAVVGLPPMGCVPMVVTLESLVPSAHMLQRQCSELQNTYSINYNSKLQALVSSLQAELGAKIFYVDVYNPMMDMIQSPSKYGFEHTLEGCCGVGIFEVGPLCNVVDMLCPDASKYLFFDALHPTQQAYFFLAKIIERTALPYLLS